MKLLKICFVVTLFCELFFSELSFASSHHNINNNQAYREESSMRKNFMCSAQNNDADDSNEYCNVSRNSSALQKINRILALCTGDYAYYEGEDNFYLLAFDSACRATLLIVSGMVIYSFINDYLIKQ